MPPAGVALLCLPLTWRCSASRRPSCRPGGRMAVVLDEEALLISRPVAAGQGAGQDPHDCHREVGAWAGQGTRSTLSSL